MGNESNGMAKIYQMIATLSRSGDDQKGKSKDIPVTEVSQSPFIEFTLRNFSSPSKEGDSDRDQITGP